MYNYHRSGLDKMTNDPIAGKKALMLSIQDLEPLFQRRPNAFLLQLFFDAEIMVLSLELKALELFFPAIGSFVIWSNPER